MRWSRAPTTAIFALALAVGGCSEIQSRTPDATEPADALASHIATGGTQSTAGGALGSAQSCTNAELGYTVEYPEGWWANEPIEAAEPDLDPIEGCMYFAPDEVELAPNAGLPPGIAVHFRLSTEPVRTGDGVLSQEVTHVGGREALVREIESVNDDPFFPRGAKVYQYLVELDAGHLVASTDTVLWPEADYERNKLILDGMMETLDVGA